MTQLNIVSRAASVERCRCHMLRSELDLSQLKKQIVVRVAWVLLHLGDACVLFFCYGSGGCNSRIGGRGDLLMSLRRCVKVSAGW